MQTRNEAKAERSFELARRFSEKVSKDLPSSNLAQAMTSTDAANQAEERHDREEAAIWAGLLNLQDGPSDTTALVELDKATNEMMKEWKIFQGCLSHEDQILLSDHPTFQTVEDAIQVWEARYENKQDDRFASAKLNFQSLCESLDAHSQLFEIFPNGDKYCSLLSGALSSIVKASVNHGRISSGFASNMVDITAEIEYWKGQISVFQTHKRSAAQMAYLKVIVAQLYSRIFRFFQAYMAWCKSRLGRFKASFDKGYYDKHVQAPMDEIIKFSRRLQREAGVQLGRVAMRTEAIVDMQLRLQLEERDEARAREKRREEQEARRQQQQQVFNDGSFDMMKELTVAVQGIYTLLGQQGFTLCQSSAEALEHDQDNNSNRLGSREDLLKLLRRSPSPYGNKVVYDHHSLETATRHLDVGDDDQFIKGPAGSQRNQQVAAKIFKELETWMTASTSILSWIYGPAMTPRPSDVSLAAGHVVAVIQKTQIPLIAYQYRDDRMGVMGTEPDRSHGMDRFIGMLYSLIRQLIWLLPDHLDTDKDFSRQRFAKLDGSIDSLRTALKIFRDLLSFQSRILVIVIDGFQFAGDGYDVGETGPYIDDFLGILRRCESKFVLKILLTTNGYYLPLYQNLDPWERVDAMGAAARVGGKRRKGGQQLLNLAPMREG